MQGRQQGNGWAGRIFVIQTSAVLGLAIACAGGPTGLDDGDFSATHENQFAALFADGPGTSAVRGSSAPGTGPPDHARNSTVHVYDSHTGPKPNIHRLASQWHNFNSRWGFHTPNSKWWYLQGITDGTDDTETSVNLRSR